MICELQVEVGLVDQSPTNDQRVKVNSIWSRAGLRAEARDTEYCWPLSRTCKQDTQIRHFTASKVRAVRASD